MHTRGSSQAVGRILPVLLGLFTYGISREVRADSIPVVRAHVDSGKLRFEAPLPASQAFDLEIVSVHTRYVSGYLDV